jgi:hypothetical protein
MYIEGRVVSDKGKGHTEQINTLPLSLSPSDGERARVRGQSGREQKGKIMNGKQKGRTETKWNAGCGINRISGYGLADSER